MFTKYMINFMTFSHRLQQVIYMYCHLNNQVQNHFIQYPLINLSKAK